MSPINVGIIGLGTVGGGAFQILERNAARIQARVGAPIRLKRVATRTPQRALDAGIDAAIVSDDVEALLNDDSIDIVAELIGGIEPARSYILRALESGKSVVTANKELIAKHGTEIRAAAERAGVDVLFEGSVGAGIPLIKSLRESLAGNEISEVLGILNGTTNFILTKMTQEGADFGEVLAEAQKLGYAEADSTADVDGFDTMYKLAILAGICFDTPVDIGDIYREGIRGVSARDIDYATELGYVIKLIALGRRDPDGRLELRVHPTLLPHSHPLASVNDSFNAVWVRGDAVGDVMFYGRGAGDLPTGSAVVADIIEAARNRARNIRTPDHSPEEKACIQPFENAYTRFCVRMQVGDLPGTIAQIAGVFGAAGVSIESIVQRHRDRDSAGGFAEIFWMMHHSTQSAMNDSLEELKKLDVVREVSSVLRVEGE